MKQLQNTLVLGFIICFIFLSVSFILASLTNTTDLASFAFIRNVFDKMLYVVGFAVFFIIIAGIAITLKNKSFSKH